MTRRRTPLNKLWGQAKSASPVAAQPLDEPVVVIPDTTKEFKLPHPSKPLATAMVDPTTAKAPVRPVVKVDGPAKRSAEMFATATLDQPQMSLDNYLPGWML